MITKVKPVALIRGFKYKERTYVIDVAGKSYKQVEEEKRQKRLQIDLQLYKENGGQ